jgi:hypothetical protein
MRCAHPWYRGSVGLKVCYPLGLGYLTLLPTKNSLMYINPSGSSPKDLRMFSQVCIVRCLVLCRVYSNVLFSFVLLLARVGLVSSFWAIM